MSCVAYSVSLALLQVCGLSFGFLTERLNAPWLPAWRRYLSCWFHLLQISLSLAHVSVPWALVYLNIGSLYWNIYTATRNRFGGNRPKPGRSFGALLTAVQATAFRREASAT